MVPLVAAPGGASAAGVTTHAYMAERAISKLPPGPLRDLLSANQDAVRVGAVFPDSGYAAGRLGSTDFGESAHWEPFVNDYVDELIARCVDPTPDPAGACADEVAHLMGTAAHGMGDETWDWLFEPRMADHGESPRDLPITDQSPEYAMDMVAIREWGRHATTYDYTADPALMRAVFERYGRMDVDEADITAGDNAIKGVLGFEKIAAGAPFNDYEDVRAAMPNSARDYYYAPGGLEYSADAIAGYYEVLWQKLGGAAPGQRVAAVNPRPGAIGVPWRALPERSGPGDLGGGNPPRFAGGRLVANFGNALLPASLDAGDFVLLGPGGAPVPLLPGFPKPGPYGDGEGGTHSAMIYPAVDLAPCTRYTARVETTVEGLGGAALAEPHSWSYVTGPPDGFEGCAPSLRVTEGSLDRPVRSAVAAVEPKPGTSVVAGWSRSPTGPPTQLAFATSAPSVIGSAGLADGEWHLVGALRLEDGSLGESSRLGPVSIDRTKPVLRARGAGRKLRVRCSEGCTVRIRGAATAKRKLGAGKTVSIRPKVRRRLRDANRLRLRIRATDIAGNFRRTALVWERGRLPAGSR